MTQKNFAAWQAKRQRAEQAIPQEGTDPRKLGGQPALEDDRQRDESITAQQLDEAIRKSDEAIFKSMEELQQFIAAHVPKEIRKEMYASIFDNSRLDKHRIKTFEEIEVERAAREEIERKAAALEQFRQKIAQAEAELQAHPDEIRAAQVAQDKEMLAQAEAELQAEREALQEEE